jgi:hypothetical protein
MQGGYVRSSKLNLASLPILFALFQLFLIPSISLASTQALVAVVHSGSNRANPLTPLLEYAGVAIINATRDISWSVSGWIDRFFPTYAGSPVNSCKNIGGYSGMVIG